MKKNTRLAQRLSLILAALNQGVRLDIHLLAEQFNVSQRTIQRDIKERLHFLAWEEIGPRFYKINQQKMGYLTEEDIERFALFASVSDLFPAIDRTFYQEKLTESVQVKGIKYENIRHLQPQFQLIQQAINEKRNISFKYQKLNQSVAKFYQISPYVLINKNGVWYLIGTDILENNKQKTFCFTQISQLTLLTDTFMINTKFLAEIKQNDSLSYGNQLPEVVIRVSAFAALFFLRRNLLPNQKLLHKLESGELLLACENVHELDILPLVQYWIPHLMIISPVSLQSNLLDKLKSYCSHTYPEERNNR